MASPAHARENGVILFPYHPYSLPRSNYSTQYNNYPIQTPTVYTYPVYNSPTVIDGCNGRNTGFSTTTGQSCIGNYVVTPTTTVVKVPGTVTTTKSDSSDTSDTNDNYSDIAANALYGSNSFMPTGIVQWIFFVILILAIIFLWRCVYAEEKYMSEPLKHA